MANKKNTTEIEEKTLTVRPLSPAEELMQIADAYNKKSLAEKYYDDIYSQMKARAEHGVKKMEDQKKSLAFFHMSYMGMPLPPDVTDLEKHLQDLYDAQEESYRMLEASGFKITKKEPNFPSLFDPNLDPRQRQLIQQEKDCIESLVTISLE